MESVWSKRRALLALALIGLVAVLLRLPGFQISQAPDEMYSFDEYVQGGPARFLVQPYQCNNQPLNSLAAWASTRLLGDSDWAMRLPAFLAALALFPVLYAFTAHAFRSRGAGLAAAFLLAVHLPHVAYSANFRSYTLVMLFAVLTSWQLMLHLERPRWPLCLGLGLTAFLMAYSHIVSMLMFAGWGLALVLAYAVRARRGGWLDRTNLYRLLGGGLGLTLGSLLTFAAYKPAFNLPRALVARVLTGIWPSDAFSFVSGAEQSHWFPLAQFTAQVTSTTGAWFWAFSALALAGCLIALRRGRVSAGVVLAVLLGPVAALLITGLKIEPRYSLVLAPLFVCALGSGVAWASGRVPARLRVLTAALLLGTYAGVSLHPFVMRYPRATAEAVCVFDEAKQTMEYVQETAAPADVVVPVDCNDPTFDHYADKIFNRYRAVPDAPPTQSGVWVIARMPSDRQPVARFLGREVYFEHLDTPAYARVPMAPLSSLTEPGPAVWTLWQNTGEACVASRGDGPNGDAAWLDLGAGYSFVRVSCAPVPCTPERPAAFRVWVNGLESGGDVSARLHFVGAPGALDLQRWTRVPRPVAQAEPGWRLLHVDALVPADRHALFAEIEIRVWLGEKGRVGLRDAQVWLEPGNGAG